MIMDKILDAKYHAFELYNQALLLYYFEAQDMNLSNYHKERMHQCFLRVAEAMGYDVILRSSKDQDEAA